MVFCNKFQAIILIYLLSGPITNVPVPVVEPALSDVFTTIEPIEVDDIEIDVHQLDIPVDLLLQEELMDTNDPLPDVALFPDQVPMETAPVVTGAQPTIPMDTAEHHAEEQLLETSSEEEDDGYDEVTGNSYS